MEVSQKHIHPLTIIQNLWRVLYLTIIPVVRSFLLALQGDLGRWIQGSWIDIMVFLLMVAVAVWRWRLVTYILDDAAITLNFGWLTRRRIRVPWERVTTVSVVRSFYLRPFRAAWLRVDTIGGSAGKADFSIIVSRNEAERVLHRSQTNCGDVRSREYRPHIASIVAMALLTSNSLGGILFIATFISQTGKLLGDRFSRLVIGTFEQASRILAFGLPPAAAAIAYMLLAGWLAGFILSFSRYKSFAVSRGNGVLNIGGGAFSKRFYRISCGEINFIDIRQSIVTKAASLYSLYISAVGYAKGKDDLSCVIPTESHASFTVNRERLFPSFSPARRRLIPGRFGFMRFLGEPLSIFAAIILAMILLQFKFPMWRSFILFVGLMSLVPALLFFTVRLVDFFTGGVTKSGSFYTLRYSKGFYLHTVIIPEDKIVCVELHQGFFQKYTRFCDLIISTRAETSFTHRCRSLRKADLQRLMGMPV